VFFPPFPATASLTRRARSAIWPVRSAIASTFFAALESFFDVPLAALRPCSGMLNPFLFLARPRAIPPASPASPTPAAIAGVLSCLAVDATALPAFFAPVTVVSLAVLIAPLLSEDFDVLRLEDAVGRGLPRDGLPFCERRVLECDLAAARPLAVALRALDRLPFVIGPDLLFIC
jgi:hypothetical protein